MWGGSASQARLNVVFTKLSFRKEQSQQSRADLEAGFGMATHGNARNALVAVGARVVPCWGQ